MIKFIKKEMGSKRFCDFNKFIVNKVCVKECVINVSPNIISIHALCIYVPCES